MRLGQLSRKTRTSTSEIVAFLRQHGVSVEDSVNVRIENEHVLRVISHFSPRAEIEESNESPKAIEPPSQPSPNDADTPVEEPVEGQELSATNETFNAPESKESLSSEVSPDNFLPDQTEPETIKAQKVELKGLKVLGRIDLPVTRKKEPETSEGLHEGQRPPAEERPSKNVSNHKRPSKRSDSRVRKNPVELQREREAKEAAEHKLEKAKKEKESRTQYYQKRVKPAAPVRAARILDEPLEQLDSQSLEQPRSLWQRFMKWLTS